MTITSDVFVNEVPWALPVFIIFAVVGISILFVAWRGEVTGRKESLNNQIGYLGLGLSIIGMVSGMFAAIHAGTDEGKVREDLRSVGVTQVEFLVGYRTFLAVHEGERKECTLTETETEGKLFLECFDGIKVEEGE